MAAAARDDKGLADGDGGVNGKRFCSMSHPATVRRECTRRLCEERAKGVLWIHSSVNLVEPRDIALAAARRPRRVPGIKLGLALPSPRRNRCGMPAQ
jgi:hypothetical protein